MADPEEDRKFLGAQVMRASQAAAEDGVTLTRVMAKALEEFLDERDEWLKVEAEQRSWTDPPKLDPQALDARLAASRTRSALRHDELSQLHQGRKASRPVVDVELPPFPDENRTQPDGGLTAGRS